MDELNTDQQIKLQTTLKSHRCGFKKLHAIVSGFYGRMKWNKMKWIWEDVTLDMFDFEWNGYWWSVRLNLLSFSWNSINARSVHNNHVFTTIEIGNIVKRNRNRSHKNEGNYYDMGFYVNVAKVIDIYRPHVRCWNCGETKKKPSKQIPTKQFYAHICMGHS